MDKCNNCGKSFHNFRNCKLPITSNGIIHVHENKYLMICRKKTLGYVDFIGGKYSVYNLPYIMNLVNEMTLTEKKNLIEWDFSQLSEDLWGGGSIEHHAREKFMTLKQGLMLNSEFVDLNNIVARSTTAWDVPEWGFPKGRRNTNESDINCALREYEEETGFLRKDVRIIQNLMPYEEIFIGSNYKAYKHKYYVGFNPTTVASNPMQYNEVSDMRFFTLEEALAAIRPYNVERKHILIKVHRTITRYFQPPARPAP